jgi:hypothetical protein
VTPQGKLWIFIGFQYMVFVALAIFAYFIDDVPEEVRHTCGCIIYSHMVTVCVQVKIQLARETFLNTKINQIMLEIEDNDDAATKHAILAQMQVSVIEFRTWVL